METEVPKNTTAPSIIGRGAEIVKNNATAALVIVIVLLVIVLYFVIYYRGIWKIGPFCKSNYTPHEDIERLVKIINDS